MGLEGQDLRNLYNRYRAHIIASLLQYSTSYRGLDQFGESIDKVKDILNWNVYIAFHLIKYSYLKKEDRLFEVAEEEENNTIFGCLAVSDVITKIKMRMAFEAIKDYFEGRQKVLDEKETRLRALRKLQKHKTLRKGLMKIYLPFMRGAWREMKGGMVDG